MTREPVTPTSAMLAAQDLARRLSDGDEYVSVFDPYHAGALRELLYWPPGTETAVVTVRIYEHAVITDVLGHHPERGYTYGMVEDSWDIFRLCWQRKTLWLSTTTLTSHLSWNPSLEAHPVWWPDVPAMLTDRRLQTVHACVPAGLLDYLRRTGQDDAYDTCRCLLALGDAFTAAEITTELDEFRSKGITLNELATLARTDQ